MEPTSPGLYVILMPWALCDPHAHPPWAHAIIVWQDSYDKFRLGCGVKAHLLERCLDH